MTIHINQEKFNSIYSILQFMNDVFCTEPCDGPPEMVIVLDASDSGVDDGPASWNGTKAYAANLLVKLRERNGIRFGFVKYGQGKGVIESNLTR